MSITRRNSSGFSLVAGLGGADAGVVDEHVDLAELAPVSAATRVQSSGSETSAVTAMQRRPSASTPPAVCEAVGAAGADGDVGAGLGQADGERGAEAGGGAGDDGDLAVEPEAVEDGHGAAH